MRFIVNLVRVLGARLARAARVSSRVHDGRSGLRDPASRSSPRGPRSCFTLLPWASMIQIADRRLPRAAAPARGSASGLALQLGWAVCCSRPAALLVANGDPPCGGAGRLTCCAPRTALALVCGASSARGSAASCSTALRSRSNTLGVVRLTFIDFVVVLVLFSHFPALGGWTLRRSRCSTASAGIGFAIADMFIGHIDMINLDIRSGQFDVVLLRPVEHAAAGDGVRPRAAPARPIAQATLVLVYALVASRSPWTPVASCCCRRASVAARSSSARSSCSARASRSGRSAAARSSNTFTYGGNMLTSYPLDIFGPWLRRLLAFVGPARVRRRTSPASTPRQARPARLPAPRSSSLAPLVALAFAAARRVRLAFSVRHYRSTGS